MSLALVQTRRYLDSTVQVSGLWKSIWSRGQPYPVRGENAHGCHGSLPVYALFGILRSALGPVVCSGRWAPAGCLPLACLLAASGAHR